MLYEVITSYQSALNATDKVRMRNCFKENGVPSPDFVEYSNEMSLEKAIEHLKFPLVRITSYNVCYTKLLRLFGCIERVFLLS